MRVRFVPQLLRSCIRSDAPPNCNTWDVEGLAHETSLWDGTHRRWGWLHAFKTRGNHDLASQVSTSKANILSTDIAVGHEYKTEDEDEDKPPTVIVEILNTPVWECLDNVVSTITPLLLLLGVFLWFLLWLWWLASILTLSR